jgi:hypothetical protein
VAVNRLQQLVNGALVVLACTAPAAWAEPPASKEPLEVILGVSWSQLSACKADSDCVAINSFVHCCQQMAIGRKYRDVVNEKRTELWQKLAPAEVKSFCSRVDCATPVLEPRCIKDQCTVRAPPKVTKDTSVW